MIQLQLSLFGSMKVSGNGEPITQFPTEKTKALLAYLVVEGERPLRRESLAALLWPDWEDAEAKRNLRQSIYRLRQLLDTAVPHLSDQLFQITRQTIQINPAHLSLDVAQFQAVLWELESHPPRQLHTHADWLERMAQAASLRRGSFLDGLILPDAPFFDEWLAIQRERWDYQYIQLLDTLTAAMLERGEYGQAQAYAAQQIGLEPWREAAHRQMMHALLGQDERAEALAQYEICRHTLESQLGLAPTAETEQLHDEIRRGTAVVRSQSPSPLYQFPTYFTPFWGRETELAEIGRLLGGQNGRLLTLIGAGGMGKTRLAITAASQLAQQGRWPDGLYFVPLATATSSAAALVAVAQAVGLSLATVVDVSTGLADFLQGKQALLVLDNYEQLVGMGAWAVDLWAAVPTLHLLITSREPLDVAGEVLLGVGGLAAQPAAHLFGQMASRIRPDFDEREQGEAIGRIVHMVGGMPLALEIAASWVRLLTCAQIADQLAANLDLLVSTWQDIPDRHQSVRAIFEQSWQMLPPARQRLWAELGLFSGGFGQEAAVAITHASSTALADLVLRSLLRQSRDGRYEMHPLLRQFALDKVGQKRGVRQRHAHYYLTQLAEHEADFYGERSAEVRGWLAPDLDNIRQAWRWAAEQGAADLLRTSERAFGRLFSQLGLYQEAITLLAEAWQGLGQAAAETAAHLRYRQAILHIDLKQYELARQHLLVAHAHWHAVGDAVHLSKTTTNLGVVAWRCGEFEAAERDMQAGLALARKEGEAEMVAYALQHVGNLAWSQGQVGRARAYLQQSLPLYRAQRDLYRVAGNLNDLGAVCGVSPDGQETAVLYFEESLALYRQLGAELAGIMPLGNLGYLALQRADYATARRLLEEGRAIEERLGAQAVLSATLTNLALVALLEPMAEEERAVLARASTYLRRALQLATAAREHQVVGDVLMALVVVATRQQNWEAAVQLAAGVQSHWPLLEGLEKVLVEAAVAQLRTTLEVTHFEALWQAGAALSQSDVVQRAQLLLGAVHLRG